MPRVLTDRACEHLSWLPPWLTDDPHVQAAVLAGANEVDRIEAALQEVVNTAFPQLAVTYLYLWEAALGLSVNPVGMSLAARQARVLAFIQSRYNTVGSSYWVQNVTALIGPDWTWERYTSGGTVPYNTIRITLPYVAGSAQAGDLEKLIELITPANTQIEISYGQGFIIEYSQIEYQEL